MTTAPTTQEMSLKDKLSPGRFPGMSGRMAAIVGCILGEHFTDPQIDELVVTSDGHVLARRSGDIGCNEFIGSELDLRRNWANLLHAAGLSADEKQMAEGFYRSAVRRAWDNSSNVFVVSP